ncbi:MAG: M48 family metalloprotease [Actinobacteria bacterium]|nr:M48 family metalloprotease [Actinomycetota bacterium]
MTAAVVAAAPAVGAFPAWSLLDPIILAAFVVLLARPVPAVLGRSQWPARAPKLALVVWAAVGAATAVSALGVLASLGVAPLGESVVPALVHLVAGAGPDRGLLHWWSWLLLACAVAAPCWVVARMLSRRWRLREARRAHGLLVDLVARWDPSLGAHVLDDSRILAYHLPGTLRPGSRGLRIVVTRGCLEGVHGPALDALLEHERAHADGRHAAVIGVFEVCAEALPFSAGARLALEEVRLLTEMLADDRAAARTGRSQVLAALVAAACEGPLTERRPPRRAIPVATRDGSLWPWCRDAERSAAARAGRVTSPVLRRAHRLVGPSGRLAFTARAGYLVLAACAICAPLGMLAAG